MKERDDVLNINLPTAGSIYEAETILEKCKTRKAIFELWHTRERVTRFPVLLIAYYRTRQSGSIYFVREKDWNKRIKNMDVFSAGPHMFKRIKKSQGKLK